MAINVKTTSLKLIVCLFELDENCDDQPTDFDDIASCMDTDINNDIHPIELDDLIDDEEYELDENCDIMPRV